MTPHHRRDALRLENLHATLFSARQGGAVYVADAPARSGSGAIKARERGAALDEFDNER